MLGPRHLPRLLPALALLVGAAAVVALLALVAGNGHAGEPFAGDVNDLLARRPDAVLDEPGRLVADREAQWGPLGIAGWRLETLERPDGRLWVETKQPKGVLSLPIVAARERTLSLELFLPAPAPGAEPRARVRLNGVELATVELTAEPRSFSIDTPAAAWKADAQNLLELEAVHAEGRPWNALGLLSVTYGEERRLELAPEQRRARLAPDTGLAYVLEAPARCELELRGTAVGEGRLELAFERLEARTGAPRAGSRTSGALAAERLAAGTRLRLPAAQGDLLRIEARWRGAGALELERLAVIAAERSARPPVVFISIDTLSARHLSVYGYGRPTTPRLAELAGEAVVFERCLANAPWTMPSYLSVMTGLFPSSHRMEIEMNPGVDVRWDAYDSWQIADNRWTLAEMLRGVGYRTAAWVDTHWLSPKFRVDQGFDFYDMEPALAGIDDPRGGIGLIHHESRKWLEGRVPGEPFFLFVHALDAHGPYLPGAPWEDAFVREPPPEGWTMVPAGSDFQTYRAMPDWMARTTYLHVPIPERIALEPVVTRYDEAILKTDEFIGKILDELRARGLYEDAVVVVSADHGESFAHDFYSHGAMWEDIVHVPLIVKLPQGAGAGTRVAQSVQLVDLYPTIRAALGLAPRDFLHGRSLLPLVRGERLPTVPLYSEGGHCEQYLVADDEWKLVVEYPARDSQEQSLLSHPRVPRSWLEANAPEVLERPLTPALFAELRARPGYQAKIEELRRLLDGPYVELYCRPDDPGELHDLADEEPERSAALRARLEEIHARIAAARADARPVPVSAPFDEAALEELIKLGYVSADRGRSE